MRAPAPSTPPTPEAYTPNSLRSDLTAISDTLPPDDPNAGADLQAAGIRGRRSIVYPHDDKDWEPPQNINGYVRDPNNQWRFLPLWLPCTYGCRPPSQGQLRLHRHHHAVQQSASATFGQRVPYTTCETCPVRSKP